VDLSTGRPGEERDNELKKPVGINPDNSGGDGEPKKAVGYMTIALKVPQPSAEVYVNGTKTSQTGLDRLFSSPELEAGKEFQYEVRVRWVENGVTCEKMKLVIGSSGETIPLDFNAPEIVRAGK
jgi:uncharacterized protein (TIGR03000 family)